MKQEIFRGIATALATPWTWTEPSILKPTAVSSTGKIESGIAGLVACGNFTGESATMTEAEHKEVIRFTVERAAGRVPVIAGTGSNCTAKAVAMTQYACSVGASACLLVTPYYNKATQAGLIAHYTAIADASDKPSSSTMSLPHRQQPATATCAALGSIPDRRREGSLRQHRSDCGGGALAGDCLAIYSGNDDHIVPVLSMGGSGCISVLSNVVPGEAQAICDRFFAGDVAGAAPCNASSCLW